MFQQKHKLPLPLKRGDQQPPRLQEPSVFQETDALESGVICPTSCLEINPHLGAAVLC